MEFVRDQDVYMEDSMNCQQEADYFDDYDRAMEAVRLSADLQDYYHFHHNNNGGHHPSQEEQKQVDTAMMMIEQDEDTQSVASDESYNNDALLNLIVGVQSYIAEVANAGIIKDSPLLELQYKMYIYMKQQACDMGYDLDDLYYP